MFSPSNFDEVCVQKTHIEASGGNTSFSSKKEFVPPNDTRRERKQSL